MGLMNARHSRRRARDDTPSGVKRPLNRLALVVTIGVLILMVLMVSNGHLLAPATVWASGEPNTITFSPTEGPVGTPLNLDLWVVVQTTTKYALTATMTDPAQGGCNSAQSIPGVAPFAVPPPNPNGIGPYEFTITWPTALNSGPYWLCAASTTQDAGPHAQSTQPFTVTKVVPTATAGATATTAATATNSPTVAEQPTVTSPSHADVVSTNPPAGVMGALIAAALVVALLLLTFLTLLWRRRTR